MEVGSLFPVLLVELFHLFFASFPLITLSTHRKLCKKKDDSIPQDWVTWWQPALESWFAEYICLIENPQFIWKRRILYLNEKSISLRVKLSYFLLMICIPNSFCLESHLNLFIFLEDVNDSTHNLNIRRQEVWEPICFGRTKKGNSFKGVSFRLQMAPLWDRQLDREHGLHFCSQSSTGKPHILYTDQPGQLHIKI